MTPEEALGEAEEKVDAPVYVDRLPDRAQGEYHYFEPVYFNDDLPGLPQDGARHGGRVGHRTGRIRYAQEPPCWRSR